MWQSVESWLAVAVAVLVKLSTSGRMTIKQTLVSVLVAVGSAYLFTEPLAERSSVDPILVAAVVALTSEGVMRAVLLALEDPIKTWRQWKGKE